MDQKNVVAPLVALGQETRLRTVQLLMGHVPGGLLAIEIATRLGVKPNTMSAHLKILEHAGLLEKRRDGRGVFYSTKPEVIGAVGDRLKAIAGF